MIIRSIPLSKRNSPAGSAPKAQSPDFAGSSPFGPFAPTTSFQENHVCKEIDAFQCDNSQNFISQCADSHYSACPLLDLIMDCRLKNSRLLYQANLGPSFLSIAQFGANSKCLRVSDPSGARSVACMRVECAPSKRAYYVSLPERFGKAH